MWNRTPLLLIALLTAANARAEGIHNDRIPADVMGYIHVDLDRILSSHLIAQGVYGKEIAAQAAAFLGEHSGLTVYLPKSGGPGGWALLWHTSDPKVRKRLEGSLADSKSFLITYNQQEIHYSPASASRLLELPADAPSSHAGHDESAKRHMPGFSIGMGQKDDPASPTSYRGPTYVAFVGQDLIVMAGDLTSIAGAVDVLQGKKPSLAQQDPQGLKVDAAPGTMVLGAGLATDNSTDASKKPHHPANKANTGGAYGFDMFGSFKASARVARFYLGDDKQIFADASLTMMDVDASEQVKNLVIGVKALVSLTHVEAKPLLVPLEIRSADKDVVLHWSWPEAKLPELLHILQEQQHSLPTAAPATLPAH